MRQALCDRVDGTRHVAMLDDRSRRAAGGSGWLSHVRLFSVSVVPANVTDVMTPDVSGNERRASRRATKLSFRRLERCLAELLGVLGQRKLKELYKVGQK